MKESSLWRTARDKLSPFGKLVRIENALASGVADVAYVLTRPAPGSRPASGWLELKQISAFPARPSTPLVVEHLTIEQVRFAESWSAAGGRAFMLLRIPPWFLLFDAAGIRGVHEREVLAGGAAKVALVAARGRFPAGPILRELT